MASRLSLTRAQILAFRRSVGSLDERLPMHAGSLRQAAWAGLQDSMPRAALLSIHARIEGTQAASWKHPSLIQVWGPRYSTYVVAQRDRAVFTLGRMPDDERVWRRVEDLADRLHDLLDGGTMTDRHAERALGERSNRLRYATLTGRVVIRWEGARAPIVRTIPRPGIDPRKARLELARRYLHIFGPGTAETFAVWAGVHAREALAAFATLDTSLTPVRTPLGDRWILTADEPAYRAKPHRPAAVRLLPSGDTYFLLQGADRELLVPDARHRAALWTPRVWPGAVLVEGEIVGTWRRSGRQVMVTSWKRLPRRSREAIDAEAASLPLPDAPAAR